MPLKYIYRSTLHSESKGSLAKEYYGCVAWNIIDGSVCREQENSVLADVNNHVTFGHENQIVAMLIKSINFCVSSRLQRNGEVHSPG